MFYNVQFKIGKARYNDEIISDMAISRKHCIFRCEDDNKWKLEDLSTSVTIINNIAVLPKVMQDVFPGDIIQFGFNVKFKYIFTIVQRNGVKEVCINEKILDHIVIKQKYLQSQIRRKRSRV